MRPPYKMCHAGETPTPLDPTSRSFGCQSPRGSPNRRAGFSPREALALLGGGAEAPRGLKPSTALGCTEPNRCYNSSVGDCGSHGSVRRRIYTLIVARVLVAAILVTLWLRGQELPP